MSNLYKDAIADARKLREAAEQNAKNRIIEAVTPKLRKMIERQINEGDEEFVDSSADLDGLLDTPEAMDMLDDEIDMGLPQDEPMANSPEPMDMDSDGFASIEVIPDEEEESSEEGESSNKSVHVNITVERKNRKLRKKAILLVKALSEAKSTTQRKKIRKEIVRLRSQLIITENRQNKRLANNLLVILKESNTMRQRKNSWLFEGKEEEPGEEMEFDDESYDEEDLDVDAIKAAVADLASAVGMETLEDEMDMEDDEDIDLDDEDMEEEEEESEEEAVADETYESMRESDEMGDEEEEEDDDEMVEVNEAMLRRALGASRRPSKRTSRLSETRQRRIARARRRRRLAEGDAKAMASSFGGGKAGKEMFVDVDENTLLNALAEELGSYGNSTAAQGKAAAKASHFGGGSIKKGAVMEARKANKRAQLAERKTRAVKKELKESNLFNAKLLFVTKIMQQHKLNNKQQRAIIEAMDNAKTQREAKLLFTSLNESLNKRSAQKLTESKNAKNSINESRTGYSNRSLQSGQAPRNSGVELDRWAVLAGIRK